MEKEDKSIRVPATTYEQIIRIKKQTKRPIKYIIELAINLLDGKTNKHNN